MNLKQIFLQYGFVALALVLGGAFGAKMLFAWLDEYLFGKKREQGLDEMIAQKLSSMGAKPTRKTEALGQRQEAKEDPRQLADQRPEDPEEAKRKEILQRIYHFDGKRGQGEAEETYYLRLLGLRSFENVEQVKRSFKQRAREFHPDLFPLALFEKSLQKRLAKRVHENYLLLQKAQDYFAKRK